MARRLEDHHTSSTEPLHRLDDGALAARLQQLFEANGDGSEAARPRPRPAGGLSRAAGGTTAPRRAAPRDPAVRPLWPVPDRPRTAAPAAAPAPPVARELEVLRGQLDDAFDEAHSRVDAVERRLSLGLAAMEKHLEAQHQQLARLSALAERTAATVVSLEAMQLDVSAAEELANTVPGMFDTMMGRLDTVEDNLTAVADKASSAPAPASAALDDGELARTLQHVLDRLDAIEASVASLPAPQDAPEMEPFVEQVLARLDTVEANLRAAMPRRPLRAAPLTAR